MWPKKSKPGTRGKKRTRPENRPGAFPPLIAAAGLLLGACSAESRRAEAEPAPVRVRLAHLADYAWRDRRQSGQPVDMKPEAERQALLSALSDAPADILVLRGLGSRPALEHLRDSLSESGSAYSDLFYIPGPDRFSGLGLLSRLPFDDTRELSGKVYRVRDREFRPVAGGARLSPSGHPPLWIWNAEHPEPDAPYERRRNEARLLAQALRPLVDAGEAVLLSLHSRESIDSPMLRMLDGAGLERLTPVDGRGDSWTHRDPRGVVYRQDQWLFATPDLAAKLRNAVEVFDSEEVRAAGAYRHQGAELRP